MLFTLAMIVIVRLGAAITTPGVNADGAAANGSVDFVAERSRGRRGGALQSLQRRRARKLRDLLARHHALHQRVDHAAAAHRGHPAARQARRARTAAGRRSCSTRATRRSCSAFSRATCSRSLFEHPESYPFLPGITDTIQRAWACRWSLIPGWASGSHGPHPDGRARCC